MRDLYPWEDAPECECGQGFLLPAYDIPGPDYDVMALFCTGCSKAGPHWPFHVVAKAWWSSGAWEGKHAEEDRMWGSTLHDSVHRDKGDARPARTPRRTK